KTNLAKITAIKLEVLPDPRLPKQGPGAISYEGPQGDFWLSEISVLDKDQKKLALKDPSQRFASGKNNAAAAIAGDPQTGWSINGGQGREPSAVFVLAEPLTPGELLHIELLFEKYYAAGLGRFRVWATGDDKPVATELATEVENLLHIAADKRSPAEQQ